MSELIKLSNYSLSYKDNDIIKDSTYSFISNNVYLVEGKNGSGKSSFIKSLLGLERNSKIEKGSIEINGSKNVLEMNDKEILELRSKIAYLEQKDYYESYRGITVFDVLKDSYEAYLGKPLSKGDIDYVKKTFDEYSPDLSFDLNKKVNKLSGGQQRMLSIIASICLIKDAQIFIIDEPLNNLDMGNIVKISNLLNKLVRGKKDNDTLFIMVTHCKIFPFVTKALSIENHKIIEKQNAVECHSCFGTHNEEGYYL